MIKIKINGKIYQAEKGETVLDVCRKNGIRIPTLCHFEGLPKEQVCRLCLVETNKHSRLRTSCGLKVEDGLEIKTESENVQKARRINLELLWADHAGRCSTCYKNRNCELQNLAEEEKLENFHFVPRRDEITQKEELELVRDNLSREVVDKKNPCIEKKGSLCVECRRCINVCPTQEFGFNFRSGQVKVETPFGKSLDCIFCGKCVEVCPVASLIPKNDFKKIKETLDDGKKMAVAVIDPEILENLEKYFGEEMSQAEFLGLLRQLGFEKIFSLELAESEFNQKTQEFIKNSNEQYLFSGANLSFNFYIEKYFPKLRANLVQIDLPEIIMSRWVKRDYARQEKINPEDIKLFFLTKQLAKKTLEGEKGVDFVLTLPEVERLAKYCKIDKETSKADFNRFVLKNKFIEKIEKPEAIKVSGIKNIQKSLSNMKTRKAEEGFYEFGF